MAPGQISCSERETHAMDSNRTRSPRASYFSRSKIVDVGVWLFCGGRAAAGVSPYGERRREDRRGSARAGVLWSVTCVYVNDAALHS
ncbi:hypothetical protein EYF80_002999 [Liparis tanakae]|uniref:Uncharacterized protein n=1 Tax=Liparis tanakae TaxID=230148 RepID=A0A4Z2J9B4_9TELE|nr:hypothetical protein EYF80_002999 [Liparis tanakae]